MKLRNALCQSLITEKTRILNFYDLLARGIGNSVGIGILVVFGDLMRNVTGYSVLISIAVAGITAVLAALCFSEFGVRFLKTETAYTYSYSYHGENVAFILGWALILKYIAGTASIIKGLITFADGLAENEISNFLNATTPINWDYDFIYFDFISFITVFLVVVPLAWKLTDYTIFNNIFTLCNILFYLAVIVAGSFKAEPTNWNFRDPEEENVKGNFVPFGVLGIVKGAAIVFYTYIGFERIVLTGHEVKNSQKNFPYASLISVTVVFFLYQGVAVILSLLCPFNKIIPRAALPLAFENVGWIAMKWIIVVGAFFCFQTSLFGAIFALPKILNSMTNDGLLFPFLNESFSKYNFGILITSLLMALLAGFLTFQSLVNLTIIGALFVSTIFAIDVVIIRYIPKEKANLLKNNFSTSKIRPTAKEIVQQMFRFNSKIASEVTENAVATNLFLLCLSSVAFGMVFGIFGGDVLELRVEAIIAAVVFAVIIIFSIGSIIAQPKSKIFSVFKVPFIPFTPCISIFLNIFLIMFLGPVNLILFLIWMGLGIIPHFIWYGIKYYQGNVGNSSLYEINRFNRLKLNESVWKIKSEKISFYAGFVNNAFQDGKDKSSTEVISVIDEKKEKIEDEKKSLELKQAVIVQVPDFSEVSQNSEQKTGVNEIIEWECVAEIHTEDEFQQSSYELEIVDNNYKFLSCVLEGPNRDSRSLNRESLKSMKSLEDSSIEKIEKKIKMNDNSDKIEDDKKEKQIKHGFSSQQQELLSLNQNEEKQSVNKEDMTLKESEDYTPQKEDENKEKEVIEKIIEKEETQSANVSNEIKKALSIKKNNNDDNNNNDSSDFNKMKNFKEQLNLFLKNQINENRTYGSIYNIKSRKNSISENSESDQKESKREIIKTLNKSEIKNKLDIILIKGPPKRASLQKSFNINMQQSDKDNEAKTAF